MTAADPRAVALLARIDKVEERLRRHAGSPSAGGLTDPDPPTGERWDYGQVWAHLGEFVPYWTEQVRHVVDASRDLPVPFGRVKTDPERIAAIERDRGLPAEELIDRLSQHLEDLRALVRGLIPADWGRQGLHQTLGEMGLPRIFDEFLVGHLESHADQLDGLRSRGPTPQPI
jgi:hypothetical protein